MMSTPVSILLTNTNAIRSTIGIDENDLSDDIILGQRLDLQMEERLSEVIPTWEALSDATEQGERRITLWCQYFGALCLLENSLLGIPQKIQASNDLLSRFTNVDWEALKTSLRMKIANLEMRINNPSITTSSRVPQLLGVSVQGYNPVTGI